MKNSEQFIEDEVLPKEQKEKRIESQKEQPEDIDPNGNLGEIEKEEPKIKGPESKEERLKLLRERMRIMPDTLEEQRRRFQREQRRIEGLRQEISERRAEKAKSNWQVFTKLWKSGQDVSRLTLLEEFLFDQNALRNRYMVERDFQENLESHWNGPKRRKPKDR